MNEILPLEGVKIIDFTRLLPGPLGTHLLSQLGAIVTKIESPKRLDYARFYEPKINGVSTLFHVLNSTKKQLILDYETPSGYEQVIEEIKNTDVLIEQFRPQAMQTFNLSFDIIKKINPKIVYISLTGYGQTGFKRNKAGHDINYLAESGLLSLIKDENGKPVIPGFQLADVAGGSYMLVSACSTGLLAQKRNKKAQYIDLSIADSIISLGAIANGMLQGNIDYNKKPFLSGYLVNYNVYECSDKKWIALGALELKFWNSFCEMVQKPNWKVFKNEELTVDLFDKEQLDKLFKTKTCDEWIALALNYDVCLSTVLELKDVLNKQHTNEIPISNEFKIETKTLKIYTKPFKTFVS